jgi:hypothetical protein
MVGQTDVAGLTISWYLPSLQLSDSSAGLGRGGARRGSALALNPHFPFAREVCALAKRIAIAYGISIESDLTSDEIHLMQPAKRVDLDRLFGFPVRTKTLLALHCLGGNVGTTILYRSVPGVSAASVKAVVAKLRRLGILSIQDGTVGVAVTPWRRELLSLLSAFGKYDKAFRNGVRTLAKERVKRAKRQFRYGLFGKEATQRVLCALAVHGPMSRSTLEARAHIFGDHRIFGRLKKMGLLIHKTTRHQTTVAFNASHPMFEPLRAYLLDLCGVAAEDASSVELRQVIPNASIDMLFATPLQLDVLVILYLAGEDGIDGADLSRLLPHHTVRNMVDKMWDFCAWGIAVEDPIDFGMIRYRLDRKFKHYIALKRLLEAVVAMYPSYRRVYKYRERLWPEPRATRERNRLARDESRNNQSALT